MQIMIPAFLIGVCIVTTLNRPKGKKTNQHSTCFITGFPHIMQPLLQITKMLK